MDQFSDHLMEIACESKESILSFLDIYDFEKELPPLEFCAFLKILEMIILITTKKIADFPDGNVINGRTILNIIKKSIDYIEKNTGYMNKISGQC
jgi:hypothetical protein